MQNRLLVLPTDATAVIPKECRDNWIHFSTASTTDPMFHGMDIERSLATKGFVVMEPVDAIQQGEAIKAGKADAGE